MLPLRLLQQTQQLVKPVLTFLHFHGQLSGDSVKFKVLVKKSKDYFVIEFRRWLVIKTPEKIIPYFLHRKTGCFPPRAR